VNDSIIQFRVPFVSGVTELGGPGGLLTIILQIVFFVAGLLTLIYLLVGGLRWITAGGDKEALAAARVSIWNALIGLTLVIAAFSIAKIIEIIFGIRIVSGVNLPGQ